MLNGRSNLKRTIIIAYVKHNNNKFDYIDGIALKKHILVDKIRYIGRESNNLYGPNGIGGDSYLEYENINEFKEWAFSLKPKDVKDKGISKRGLNNFKKEIREKNGLKNKSKIVKILFGLYKSH